MLKYIVLGIIQGFTEFFPVSSSGHLVIVQQILGMRGEELALAVVLHLGTVGALLVYFYKDIVSSLRNPKIAGYILLVTVITGAIGIAGKDFFEQLFSSSRYVGVSLFVTGIILIAARKARGKRGEVFISDALVLGVTQGVAIVPGISRSGVTIATLLFRGIEAEAAFRFSFLAAVPAIIGAAVLDFKDIALAAHNQLPGLAAGFIASMAAGLCALGALRKILLKAKFHYFGYYCIVVAVLVFIFLR